MSKIKNVKRSNTFLSVILFVVVFISGAVVMSLEILGSRILAPYFGNTLFVWGSLIGIVLTSLGIGYYLGGKIADKKANINIVSQLLFVSGIFILLIPIFAPLILNSDFIITNAKYGPLMVIFILFTPPTILLGMVSPFAIKLKAKEINKLGNVVGNLYFVSTIGSIVGTFLTVFYLIPAFGVKSIILSLSMILIFVSLFGLERRKNAIIILIIVLVLLPSNLVRSFHMFNNVVNKLNYKTIYETDSAYYHIIVAEDRDKQHNSHKRILFLDNVRHSSMYLDNTSESSFVYPYYFHLGYLFNPRIKDILFIGGGGLSAPKKFLKEYKDVTIDVVEIDPKVEAIAKKYFAIEENKRLNIFIDDGRQFLLKTNKTYDLIILDAYSNTYVPFHLMTLEFFQIIDDHLKDDGIVISNLVTALLGDLSNLYRAEYKTMAQFFPQIYVFPTVKDKPFLYTQNVILIGTKSKDPFSKEELLQRATNVKIGINVSDFVNNYLEKKVKTLDVSILTDDYAPANNLLNPLIGTRYVIEERN